MLFTGTHGSDYKLLWFVDGKGEGDSMFGYISLCSWGLLMLTHGNSSQQDGTIVA